MVQYKLDIVTTQGKIVTISDFCHNSQGDSSTVQHITGVESRNLGPPLLYSPVDAEWLDELEVLVGRGEV